MTERLQSWVETANNETTNFPLNNLPYGVFSTVGLAPRCGVAIGDMVLDVKRLEVEGIVSCGDQPVFSQPGWNQFMEVGPNGWSEFRTALTELLLETGVGDLRDRKDLLEQVLVPLNSVTLHMPFVVAEYTDFYSGKNHATNVGTMFRGADNALPKNWLHMPIGYNGRASSVVVSGTDIRRPWGQLKSPEFDAPIFAPSRRFDIELEMGAIVGVASDGPISVKQADANIFGYVLLNDWSARDIQAWEYQPLGPFQAKATATTISPWIIPRAALEPFRIAGITPEKELLPHLAESSAMKYKIDLQVTIQPGSSDQEFVLANTNSNQLYYSSAQQLAHHATSGCPMRVGDLLGTGTISGDTKESRGSLLELSWGGKEPIELGNGGQRTFIQDGDRLALKGVASGQDYKIGFGDCTGKILPALTSPIGGDSD